MSRYVITIKLKEMPENGKNILKYWVSVNNLMQATIHANSLLKYYIGDLISIKRVD
jgi:hypothetical protein